MIFTLCHVVPLAVRLIPYGLGVIIIIAFSGVLQNQRADSNFMP
jgi:hypothetical protein